MSHLFVPRLLFRIIPRRLRLRIKNMLLSRRRPKAASFKAEVDLESRVRFLQLQSTESMHCSLKPFPLRILYVAPRYDYADASRGLSYHEGQTLHCLLHCGHQVIRFDFEELALKLGAQVMNELLLEAVVRYRPHIAMFMLHRPGIWPETLSEIGASGTTTTFGIFGDDLRRFDDFSSGYAQALDWVGTDWEPAVEKYRALGQGQALFRPYTCNHFFYQRLSLPQLYDVSFVGIPYGRRQRILQRLKTEGIPVETWGYGAPNGRLSQRQMVRVINQSRVNLDLYGRVPDDQIDDIRARPFEVTGSGGFLITSANTYLERFFELGKEVVCYNDEEELLWQVRHYLDHGADRERIAEKGYQRTIRDHTLEGQLYRDFKTILAC